MPGRNHPTRQTGPALEKDYQFLTWLLARVEKFPRSQKFTLGDRIAGLGLDIREDSTEATCTRDRRDILRRANIRLQKLRILTVVESSIRLAPVIDRRFGYRAGDAR